MFLVAPTLRLAGSLGLVVGEVVMVVVMGVVRRKEFLRCHTVGCSFPESPANYSWCWLPPLLPFKSPVITQMVHGRRGVGRGISRSLNGLRIKRVNSFYDANARKDTVQGFSCSREFIPE